MKKLFLLLFMLGAGLSVQAQQYNSKELSDLFSDELYPLAKDISEYTNKVIAYGNVISIVKKTGTTSLAKKKIEGISVEAHSFSLLTSSGKEINLNNDMLLANKVVNKFFDVLRRVKESMKEDNRKEVEDILNSL
ncbi:hypothetical protein [Aquimarina algicola]|uniref:DUF4468 domain-containing protein n=1 Tax=Aquimarina algicola TaxID=2589995 RepID=A0A504JAD9_9FLAO|nr:hypothetical protein [Aquimarina algicola]TPN87624.1 hypothetical protein FHK87_08580 [Aquimarina algicola]